MFPRSANKPFQAAAMRGCGLGLDGTLLALAAASHSGESFHVEGVREILASAGLTEDALGCPPSLPLDPDAQRDLLRAGGGPDQVHMNCSGKHAGMLATCVAAGWPTSSYLDPSHPLQQAVRQTAERLSGEEVGAAGVDGCGAPLFALSLTGLARTYRALVMAEPGAAGRMVADAMRANPAWVSGTHRPECALMSAVPGMLVKGGAEGVQAFALPDGRAAAFKVEDGASRAVPALTVALLRCLRVGETGGQPADTSALDKVAEVPVLGGGRVVGEIRVSLPW